MNLSSDHLFPPVYNWWVAPEYQTTFEIGNIPLSYRFVSTSGNEKQVLKSEAIDVLLVSWKWWKSDFFQIES